MKIKKTADKVAILGTVRTWKEAPFKDPSWEIWGMNAFWDAWGEHATRWFEIHDMAAIRRDGWKRYRWMTKCEIPIYMKKHYSEIPASIAYPLADVSKGYLKMFSSTFCYQLALAIHEGFKTIGLYGVDFSRGTLRERFVELRGVLYWLGVAAGRGIKIQFPPGGETKFTHPYLYGMEYWREVRNVRKEMYAAFILACAAITDGAR